MENNAINSSSSLFFSLFSLLNCEAECGTSLLHGMLVVALILCLFVCKCAHTCTSMHVLTRTQSEAGFLQFIYLLES